MWILAKLGNFRSTFLIKIRLLGSMLTYLTPEEQRNTHLRRIAEQPMGPVGRLTAGSDVGRHPPGAGADRGRVPGGAGAQGKGLEGPQGGAVRRG